MCMSFVAVGRSLTIVSYVAFKMAALWFWTMFNCNPPIALCHPFLCGGGILVDHWSTISSCYWYAYVQYAALNICTVCPIEHMYSMSNWTYAQNVPLNICTACPIEHMYSVSHWTYVQYGPLNAYGFVVLCFVLVVVLAGCILQGSCMYWSSLLQCQWSNPEGYVHNWLVPAEYNKTSLQIDLEPLCLFYYQRL